MHRHTASKMDFSCFSINVELPYFHVILDESAIVPSVDLSVQRRGGGKLHDLNLEHQSNLQEKIMITVQVHSYWLASITLMKPFLTMNFVSQSYFIMFTNFFCRGNSKYHYYGIRIKSSSILNQYQDDGGHTAMRQQPINSAKR